MSNHHLRLRTIEVAMTPEDIVLFWLESARNAGGFKEGTFCSPAPRAYIANAVSASVSAATREMDRDATQQAIRESQQRADSLYLLAITINVAGSECSREANVRSLLMTGYLRTVLQVPEGQRADSLPFFRVSLLLGFESLLITEDAVTRVSKEHLSGHELLFYDVKKKLKAELQSFALLCQGFNFLALEEEDEIPIDLDLYRSVLETHVVEQVSGWKTLARLEMLDRFGERDACRTQLEKFLRRTGRASHSSE